MSNLTPVNIPDIGDVSKVDVIEVLVAVGDSINIDDSLITLETDKATMDLPATTAGIVKAVHLKVGDKVSQGDLMIEIETDSGSESKSDSERESENQTDSKTVSESKDNKVESETAAEYKVEKGSSNSSADSNSKTSDSNEPQDLMLPDIGDSSDVDVIEVLVSVGDSIDKDQSIIVLETDKATMEVPAEVGGKLVEVLVKVGDKVSQGDLIARIQGSSSDAASEKTEPASYEQPQASASSSAPAKAASAKAAPVPDHPQMKKRAAGKIVHASPAVRRFARELGADLEKVNGSGPKGRILKDDVQNFIKFELSRPKATAASGSMAMPEMPEVDHEKWGAVQTQPLTRIQKISSVNLHRNWVSIPHVTQHEDADITELDAFRKSLKDEAIKDGVRLTPLAFIMKGLVHTLKAFPKFNASLANDGENLIVKDYYHIGVAVETPNGLTVPVIRDVDQKGIYQLATELGEISAKARDMKLSANDMQGSSFTISSLGGIGGTAFSPIVKWPDVAILGLSRNKMQPVWNGSEFIPRLMLPMSLSYDHRVIDGADAARFVVHLSQTLADIRRVLLK